MEFVKKWSWPTLGLYVFLAVLIAFLFRQAIIAKKNKKTIKIFKFGLNIKYIHYFIIFIIFVMFSAFRFYNNEIGGTDTIAYEGFFSNIKYVPFNIEQQLLHLDGQEYLFYNLMYIVNLLGGNFLIFNIIVYSIIIICYIFVIDKTINDEKKWFWLILLFIPMLKSLNIIRNCFSAVIGFVGITLLQKKNWQSNVLYFIISVIALLNHHTAVILLGFGIFYLIIPDKLIINRKWLIILNIACVILSISILPIAKILLAGTGFAVYLNYIDISLYGYMPILVFYCLMLFDKHIVNYLKEIGHFVYYKVMVFVSFILPIFILLDGANRILLFFDIPRFILYSDLYTFYRKKMPNKLIRWYDVACIAGVIVWLIFRIWRIWDGYGLMPYYNILFM